MKKFFIIDGNSYIYRAYHAIRGLKNRDGFPTNAVYGFISMLMKIFQEKPDYIVVVFDAAKKTFRNDIYPEYKANRPPMPDDLVVQIPYIKKAVNAFNIPVLEEEGFEADDIIATLINKFKKDSMITVVSSDKDLMQLIDDNVIMWDTLKDVKFTNNNVHEKFGVPKENIIDYLALVGDKSDNIPGVKGVGNKTATALINRFGSIENIYDNLEKIEKERLKKLLSEGKESAFLSKKLIKLKEDLNYDFEENFFKLKDFDKNKLKELFKELEFSSLMKKFDFDEQRENYLYEITDIFPNDEKVSGIVLSYKEGFFHESVGSFTGNGKDIFITNNINEIKAVSNKYLINFSAKDTMKVFQKLDIKFPEKFEDVQLMFYLFDPELKNNLENIAYTIDKKFIKPIEEYKEKKNVKINFGKLSEKNKKIFLAERTCAIFSCFKKINEKLKDKLSDLYEKVEKPVVKILNCMETHGIFIDTEILEKLNKELTIDLEKLTDDIYKIAGREFNINSPKQLREILFEELQLEVVKKTKTGASTDNEVLEYLSGKHPLPFFILDYREKAKLKSTYLEGLLKLIDRKTSRIYPVFQQTVTATGRLSCTNPNIQNIPIRTEYGNKIRKAFAAPEGFKLVALDYSQIELRLMAHFSEDKELLKAFENDIDVHTLTASKIYNTNIESVDEQMRRDGKTVNFAIIYGISPFGLGKSLKVTREKAKTFIENYFKEYTGVKNFMENIVKFAKEKGFVETLLGRIRYIKGINNRNHQEREFAKRTAINTPIQGSAADIIKLAMIETSKILPDYKAHMIMQIHDELIFEVPENLSEKFALKAKEIMENVYPGLKAPLKVDVGIGANWYEAH